MSEILINACPTCGAEEALSPIIFRVIDDEQLRGMVGDVLQSSFPLGGTVLRYVELFKPAKHKLNWARVRKVLEELVPDVQRASIERDGRVLAVSERLWLAAFASTFDAVQRGTLRTPLSSNGYLYGALRNLAEKATAKAEEAREADRRHGGARVDTVTLRGQELPIGEALQAVYGGKDPALAKIDADSKRAAPMPEKVRKRIAELRGKAGEA